MSDVAYFAVYRSDTIGDPEKGYSGVCVALFGDVDDAIDEARRLLADRYHVMIDQGTMPQAEWDALEEVPDDFVARQPEASEAS
jgi:hypothetical protein